MIHFSSTARNEFSPEKERERMRYQFWTFRFSRVSEIKFQNSRVNFTSINIDEKSNFPLFYRGQYRFQKLTKTIPNCCFSSFFFSQKLLNLLKFSFRRETMSFVCECKIVVQFFRVSRNIFSLFSFLFFFILFHLVLRFSLCFSLFFFIRILFFFFFLILEK